ncbi:hypothetical protein ABK040_005038 [Willaertia magna]
MSTTAITTLSALPDEIFPNIFKFLIGDVFPSTTSNNDEEEEIYKNNFGIPPIENIFTLINMVTLLNKEYSNKFTKELNFKNYWKKVYNLYNELEYSTRTKTIQNTTLQFGRGDRSFQQRLELAKIQQILINYESGELEDDLNSFINTEEEYFGDEENDEEFVKKMIKSENLRIKKNKDNLLEEINEKYKQRLNLLKWKDYNGINNNINEENCKEICKDLEENIFQIVCCKLFNLSLKLIENLDSTHDVDVYSSFDSYLLDPERYKEWKGLNDEQNNNNYFFKKRRTDEDDNNSEFKFGLFISNFEAWKENFEKKIEKNFEKQFENKNEFKKFSFLSLNNILQFNPFKEFYIFPSSIKYLSLEVNDFSIFGLKKKVYRTPQQQEQDKEKNKEENKENKLNWRDLENISINNNFIFPNVQFLRIYFERTSIYSFDLTDDNENDNNKYYNANSDEVKLVGKKIDLIINLFFKEILNRKVFPKVNHFVVTGCFDFNQILTCDLLPQLLTLELIFDNFDFNGYTIDFWKTKKEKEELEKEGERNNNYRMNLYGYDKDYDIISNVKKLMDSGCVELLQLLVVCVGLDVGFCPKLKSEKVKELYEMTRDKFVVSIAGTSVAKLYETTGE